MDDITIIDLDLKKTTWSRVHSSMRTLYLKLSADPGLDWVRFFREERESRVVVKRHGLWIEDGYIVFDCLLEDVETHHLPDFRKSVEYANARCREAQVARVREVRQRRDDVRSEQQQLATLRAHVREAAPPSMPVAPARPPPAVRAPSADAGGQAKFEANRKDLRARFRAALKSRTKESARGND